MKKLLYVSMLLAVSALAASTFTQWYDLEKPQDGSTSWGPAIRDAFDTIDNQLHANFVGVTSAVTLATPQTITGQKTFTQPIIALAGITNSVGESAINHLTLNQLTMNGTLRAFVSSGAVVVTDPDSNLAASGISAIQLVTDLSGVTSNIQFQLNGKEPTLTKGALTSSTTALTVTGGSGSMIGAGTSLAIANASPSQDGLLTAANFNAFLAGSTGSVSKSGDSMTGDLTLVKNFNGESTVQIDNENTGTLAFSQFAATTNDGTLAMTMTGATSAVKPSLSSSSPKGLRVAASAGPLSLFVAGTDQIVITTAVALPALTGSRALVIDASKNIQSSPVTSAELAFLSGATGNIQAQISALSGVTSGGGCTNCVLRTGDSMTGTLSFGTSANGTFDAIKVVNNNTTSSQAAGQLLFYGWNGATTQLASAFGLTNNSFSGFGDFGANQTFVEALGTGGLSLWSLDANAPMLFYTGGNTLANKRMAIDNVGNVSIPGLTASRAVVTDGSKNLSSSVTTLAELALLSGATANIQAQISSLVGVTSGCTNCVVRTGDTMSGALAIRQAGVSNAFTLARLSSSRGQVTFGIQGDRAADNMSGGTFDELNIRDSAGAIFASIDSGFSGFGPGVFFGSGTDAQITHPTTNTLSFNTAGAQNMTLDGSGNLKLPALTASKVVITDGSKNLTSGGATATEVSQLAGVTANVQTQLNALALASVSVASPGDANYAITAADRFVRTGIALTTVRTYTLPACTGANVGEVHYVKKSVSTGSNLSLALSGADTLDGSSGPFTLTGQAASNVYCAANTKWENF